MNANACTALCSMEVPAGIWIAEFTSSGTPSFVLAAIVPASVTGGTFDDFSQLVQYTNTLAGQTFIIPTPMRYYCGSASAAATGNHATNYTSVLRAVRVG